MTPDAVCWQVFGLASASGSRRCPYRPPLPEPPRGQCVRVKVVLAYRCGAVPDSHRVPFSPGTDPGTNTNTNLLCSAVRCQRYVGHVDNSNEWKDRPCVRLSGRRATRATLRERGFLGRPMVTKRSKIERATRAEERSSYAPPLSQDGFRFTSSSSSAPSSSSTSSGTFCSPRPSGSRF